MSANPLLFSPFLRCLLIEPYFSNFCCLNYVSSLLQYEFEYHALPSFSGSHLLFHPLFLVLCSSPLGFLSLFLMKFPYCMGLCTFLLVRSILRTNSLIHVPTIFWWVSQTFQVLCTRKPQRPKHAILLHNSGIRVPLTQFRFLNFTYL